MTKEKHSRTTEKWAGRAEEMKGLLRDQERSGLSQRDYCDLIGMPLSTLTGWRGRFKKAELGKSTGKKSRKRDDFVEVKLLEETAIKAAGGVVSPIEITLPGGSVMRIPQETGESMLGRIVRALCATC